MSTYRERWKAQKLLEDPDYFNRKARESFAQNKDKINARRRELYAQNPEFYRAFSRQWQAKNPDYIKNYYKKYNAEHPEHSNLNKQRTNKMAVAHNHAEDLPLAKFCEVCPEDDIRLATQRHHPDYNYPKIFFSSCQGCHTSHHKREGRGEAA